MAQLTKKRIAIVIVFLSAVIPVIWGLLPLLIRPTLAQEKWYPPGLVEAKKRWDARPFSRYRMVLEYRDFYDSIRCEAELDIQDEKIIGIYRNTCDFAPTMTVSRLFDLIERDATNIEWVNHSRCDALIVYPTYNSQFGFPEEIKYRQESPDETNRVYWPPSAIQEYELHRKTSEFCTGLLMFRTGLRIRSLTPLPESVIF